MQLVKWEHWYLKLGSLLQCNSFKHYTTELFMQMLGKQWSGLTLKYLNENLNVKATPL